MTNHIMIDIETMGVGVDASILSIGAIRFNPFTMLTDTRDTTHTISNSNPTYFYERATLKSNLAVGRVVDAQTLETFWMENLDAFKEATSKPRVGIKEMLNDLRHWYNMCEGNEPVWANGSTFDLTILNHAYETVLGSRPPWRYKDELDLRTMYRFMSQSWSRTNNPEKHNPVWDSWAQAMDLARIFRDINIGVFNYR